MSIFQYKGAMDVHAAYSSSDGSDSSGSDSDDSGDVEIMGSASAALFPGYHQAKARDGMKRKRGDAAAHDSDRPRVESGEYGDDAGDDESSEEEEQVIVAPTSAAQVYAEMPAMAPSLIALQQGAQASSRATAALAALRQQDDDDADGGREVIDEPEPVPVTEVRLIVRVARTKVKLELRFLSNQTISVVVQQVLESLRIPETEVKVTLYSEELSPETTLTEAAAEDGDSLELELVDQTVLDAFVERERTLEERTNADVARLAAGGGGDGHGEAGEAEDDGAVAKVRLVCQSKEYDELKVRVSMDTPLSRVIERFCQLHPEHSPSSVSLMFDGERCGPNTTPEDLDLEDDDVLDINVR
jgi:hypothetical protein